jgi:hypothetical protein
VAALQRSITATARNLFIKQILSFIKHPLREMTYVIDTCHHPLTAARYGRRGKIGVEMFSGSGRGSGLDSRSYSMPPI